MQHCYPDLFAEALPTMRKEMCLLFLSSLTHPESVTAELFSSFTEL